jgi:taurine dioxygenase
VISNAGSATILPLSPALGAVIEGANLSSLPDTGAAADVRSALDKHLVLFFREQHLTPIQQRNFASLFGTLYTHPFHPGADGAPEVMVLEHDERRKAAQNSWHTDVTYIETPPDVEVLCGEIIPPTGGDTCWASMYAAYEALSPALRQLLDGLQAVHDFAKDFPPARFLARDVNAPPDVYAKHPPVVHPAVRTNTITGRKALFVNSSFTTHIEGLQRRESDAILAFLFEHVAQPEFHVRWRWRAGDVVVWDNRWTQHYALSDYFPQHRRVRRATVIGSRPV